MTFFLGEKPPMVRRGPDVALPSNSEAIGAAARGYWQSINVMMQRERQVIGERDGTALGAAKAMGSDMTAFIDEYNQRAEAAGLTDRRLTPDMTPEEVLAAVGPNGSKRLLEMAREKAAQDPTKFGDLDLSDEGIEARVTEKRKAEAAADAAAVALSPNPIRNELIGGLGAGILDPVNLALVPFGLGGGSLLRVLSREALLGATAEAAQFPTRTRVAEELGQEAPDFISSIAMGAITGGVLGGAFEGIPRVVRGIMAVREARKIDRTPDISPTTQEAAVGAAEKAIAEGMPVDKAVAKVILDQPAAPRRPLILDESMAVTPEPTALAPDPITEMPLEPVPGIQSTTDQITATAESGIRKAQKKPIDLSTFVVRSGGIWKGDDRGEIAALEYKRPGFIKTTKFAQSSAGDNKGGRTLDDMRQMAEEAGYLPPQSSINDLLDALGEDVKGRKRYAQGEAGTSKKTYDPDYVPERVWSDPDPEARGYLVNDLEARQMAEPDRWQEILAADVDGFIASKGFTLLPRERDEIMSIASTRGGDVEDLVYSAMSREIDEAEQAVVRTQRGEAYGRPASNVPWGEETGLGPVPDRPDGSPALEPQAAIRDAAQPPARAGEFAVERTDIGDQYVIPGSREAPSVDKQRQQAEIEARKLQSKIGRLNQARVEDDVDGLFAAKTVDLFDDLNSPQAQSFMDSNIQAMRDMLEEGDFPVGAMADDGRALNSLSDIMDEIDETDALVREYAKCRGGATE